MTVSTISRQIPLDQLVLPETDVRQGRDPDQVRSLASSMGDPEIGQQQPINVYPADHADVVDDGTQDDLVELFEADHPLVIHDGVSRYRAAEQLGWSTLWAVLTPEPPENEVVARLEANTENLDMSDYEVYSALYDHYQDADATLDDVGAKIGVSASYISNVFGLFEAPGWLRDAWERTGHPLETCHALAVRSMLSENSLEEYARAGSLNQEEALARAEDDARLMIDVQAQHDLGVSDFRQRCQRCRKETLDSLQDQRTIDEKRADGQTDTADDQADHVPPEPTQPDPCTVCGQPADRKIALDVCREDYGMLSEMKANGDVLMAQAKGPGGPPDSPPKKASGAGDAAEALAEATGIDPRQAQTVVDQVQEEAEKRPEAPQDD
jgi:ParB-like chromosome segregation protein Spo0J